MIKEEIKIATNVIIYMFIHQKIQSIITKYVVNHPPINEHNVKIQTVKRTRARHVLYIYIYNHQKK